VVAESHLSHASRGGVIRWLLRDARNYFLATAIPALISLASAVIFTHLFAPAQYGLYSLSMAVSLPLVDVLTQWIIQPATRFYAEYDHAGRKKDYLCLLLTLMIAIEIVLLVLGGLVIIGAHLIGGMRGALLLIAGAVAVMLTRAPQSILAPTLRAQLRVAPFQRATISAAFGSLLLPLVLIWIGGKNVVWLLWGSALATTLIIPYMLFQAGLWGIFPVLELSPYMKTMLRRFVRYGIPMMLWTVGANVLSIEDRYVIAAFRGSAEVGIYSVNYSLISGIGGLLNATIYLAAGPIIYYQWGHKLFDIVEQTIAKTTELYAVVGLAFVGGTLAVGPILDHIVLGREFRTGGEVLFPIAVGMFFVGLAGIGHKSLELTEQTVAMASSAGLAGALNLVLNLILVPIYGYRAAADVTAASYAAYAVFIWWQTRASIPWRIELYALLRYIFPTAIATTVVLVLTPLFPIGQIWIRLAAGSLFFVLIYTLITVSVAKRRLVWLLEIHRPDDK
jgi:O-antigen/teichoic acid export membrane protein